MSEHVTRIELSVNTFHFEVSLLQFLLQPTMPDIQMFHSSDASLVANSLAQYLDFSLCASSTIFPDRIFAPVLIANESRQGSKHCNYNISEELCGSASAVQHRISYSPQALLAQNRNRPAWRLHLHLLLLFATKKFRGNEHWPCGFPVRRPTSWWLRLRSCQRWRRLRKEQRSICFGDSDTRLNVIAAHVGSPQTRKSQMTKLVREISDVLDNDPAQH